MISMLPIVGEHKVRPYNIVVQYYSSGNDNRLYCVNYMSDVVIRMRKQSNVS